MRLLHLLAEALSAEKEAALRNKFVQVKDKENPMAAMDPSKISEKEFKALLDIDETPNGTYLNWIIPRYVKLDRTERKRFFEDGHNERVKELLTFFNNPSNKPALKRSINNPIIKDKVGNIYLDINQYKSLHDFESIMSSVKSLISYEENPTNDQTTGKKGGEPKFVSALQYPQKIGTTPSGFTVYKIPQSCKGSKECFREYRQLIGDRKSTRLNSSHT